MTKEEAWAKVGAAIEDGLVPDQPLVAMMRNATEVIIAAERCAALWPERREVCEQIVRETRAFRDGAKDALS